MRAVLKPFHPHVFLIGHGDMGSQVAADLIDTQVQQPPPPPSPPSRVLIISAETPIKPDYLN
jgi:hypothetical protein